MTGVSGNISNDLRTLQGDASHNHGKLDPGVQQYAKDFEKEAAQQGFGGTADAVKTAAADGHWSGDDNGIVSETYQTEQNFQLAERSFSGADVPPIPAYAGADSQTLASKLSGDNIPNS